MLNNGNSISMKKSIYNFSRVLGAFLLCTGLVFAGCTDDPLGDNQKTEQGGNEDKGPATLTLDKTTAATATFAGHLNVAASDLFFHRLRCITLMLKLSI